MGMTRLTPALVACGLVAYGLLVFAGPSVRAADPTPTTCEWPCWRGPDGTGQAVGDVPLTWDAKSVVWKTLLKGRGQSTPVICGDRIFLTTALENGRQRVVFCVGRKDGKVLWEQTAWTGNPEPSHELNGWASATCCTDGERVYASFGKGGLHCYTAGGEKVWSRDLGQFQSKNKRGTAASPVLAGNLVILNGDSESDPFMFGLDKLTGKTVWKADRPKAEGYSTPVLVKVDGHNELVLNGEPYVAGYDPTTGKELWKCKSFAGRGEPTPALAGNGTVCVVNGLPGDVYAVRLGGSGDVTKTHMAWHTPRKSNRDGPSPVVAKGAAGDVVLVCNMTGIATGYDVAAGKELWQQRIGGGQITSSPLAAGRRAYFVFEKEGETVVVDPADGKVLARNLVGAEPGELFRASPVAVAGQVFLRSDKALYCVGAGK